MTMLSPSRRCGVRVNAVCPAPIDTAMAAEGRLSQRGDLPGRRQLDGVAGGASLSITAPTGSRHSSRPADRDHAGTLQTEVVICTPHLGDPEDTQEDQAGGVHVSQFAAAQMIESIDDGSVMIPVEAEEFETRQLGQGQTKRASGILAQAVEEPPVCLRDHRQGRVPAARRVGEEAQRCGVIAIRPIEEGDEDSAIEKGRPLPHGRPRP